MSPPTHRPRWGTWVILGVLLLLLMVALAVLYVGWRPGADDVGSGITTTGYVAMGLGIVVTLALGIGLMALTFASSRRDRE